MLQAIWKNPSSSHPLNKYSGRRLFCARPSSKNRAGDETDTVLVLVEFPLHWGPWEGGSDMKNEAGWERRWGWGMGPTFLPLKPDCCSGEAQAGKHVLVWEPSTLHSLATSKHISGNPELQADRFFVLGACAGGGWVFFLIKFHGPAIVEISLFLCEPRGARVLGAWMEPA